MLSTAVKSKLTSGSLKKIELDFSQLLYFLNASKVTLEKPPAKQVRARSAEWVEGVGDVERIPPSRTSLYFPRDTFTN